MQDYFLETFMKIKKKNKFKFKDQQKEINRYKQSSKQINNQANKQKQASKQANIYLLLLLQFFKFRIFSNKKQQQFKKYKIHSLKSQLDASFINITIKKRYVIIIQKRVQIIYVITQIQYNKQISPFISQTVKKCQSKRINIFIYIYSYIDSKLDNHFVLQSRLHLILAPKINQTLTYYNIFVQIFSTLKFQLFLIYLNSNLLFFFEIFMTQKKT
ncbi:transmembrane protein, putative (macronuclear) [Tetrahymena thermophila SB210]|uniref:Transmembrane protein, putative n=1 Tax=Tetrahymena thermophila (strain SB210) TaxID=312017 RepID=W7X298_TETTS|nr:transmembrane protein, putative [Tetrahymena thermophila SB210]EWS71762.1 transmembrane protein, putative [Tetrahymena thermophila SB210]|eukprot:XP_012655715.1 transmembrane protein, putative [Tetrahymena thermophila SB210]